MNKFLVWAALTFVTIGLFQTNGMVGFGALLFLPIFYNKFLKIHLSKPAQAENEDPGDITKVHLEQLVAHLRISFGRNYGNYVFDFLAECLKVVEPSTRLNFVKRLLNRYSASIDGGDIIIMEFVADLAKRRNDGSLHEVELQIFNFYCVELGRILGEKLEKQSA